MTISYPLAFPTNLNPSSVVLYQGNVNGVGSSPYTMQQQVFEYGGDAWGIQVSLDPLTREEAAPWMAFLASLRGRRGTFYYGPNIMGTPLGAGAGMSSPKVKGAGQVGFSVITDGWANNTLVLKAGDLFEISSRLYMNLADATTNGSGEVTLDVWPSLRSPADNADIVTTSPKGTFRLNTDTVRLADIPNTQVFTIAFEAQEAV